jgi:lipopolysaccharide export LptBFGC system permease protein LptF
MGSVLDRYLGSGFLRIFLASLLIITSLLIVDFFDRVSVS